MNGHETAIAEAAVKRPNAADRERARYWARKTGRHTPYYVPVAAVAEHVEILRQAGLSVSAVAAAAGISHVALRSALTHGHTSVSASIAVRVLAVRARLEQYPDQTFIPAVGSRRRLQALACMGWTAAQVADAAAVPVSTVVKLRAGEVSTVRAWMARAVCAVYARLSAVSAPAGPSASRMRNAAARNGWAPPIAWDDAAIDDPDVLPEFGGRAPRPLEVWEDVEFIRRTTGVEDRDVIAGRLGITRDTLDRNLDRARVLLASAGASDD